MKRLTVLTLMLLMSGVAFGGSARTFTYGGIDHDWTTVGNWNTYPVKGDTVTIAAGSVCNYDVPTGSEIYIAGLTINGELDFNTVAGSWGIKCSGNISGAATGVIRAGTSVAVPYPATCTAIIDFNSTASGFSGFSGQMDLFCIEPTHKTLTLSVGEAANATVYRVGTDIRGDTNPWYADDTVYICNVNKGQAFSVRTIAAGGIAEGAITMNAGTSGATIVGALLVNVTRNVRIQGSTGTAITGPLAAGSTISAAITTTSSGTGMVSVANTVVGGTISGNGTGQYVCYGNTNSGTISGNSTGQYLCYGNTNSGTINGNGIGQNFCCGDTNSGVTFTGNTTADQYAVVWGTSFNTLFGSSVENSQYNTTKVPLNSYVVSYDHDQVAGAFKSWTRGGITISDTTPANLPAGYAVAFKHTCESATAQCFRQEQVSLSPGATLKIDGKIRIDGGLDHSAWAPRVEIIGCDSDPLADATKTPLATASVAQPNGSVSTYQAVTVSFTNTNVLPRMIYVRISAKRASGNVYSVYSRDVNYPAVTDVRTGTTWGYMGTTLTGTCAVPTLHQVLTTIPVDATTGDVVLPAVTDVRDNVTYGSALGMMGTMVSMSPPAPAHAVNLTWDYGVYDLRYLVGGVPVDGGNMTLFGTDGYRAGHTGPEYIRGQTSTNALGKWIDMLVVEHGSYAVQFSKVGQPTQVIYIVV